MTNTTGRPDPALSGDELALARLLAEARTIACRGGRKEMARALADLRRDLIERPSNKR